MVVNSYLRVSNKFLAIRDAESPVKGFYIPGAIEIIVDRQRLLGTAEWDYVDQLWAYLIEGVQQVLAGQEFTTFFPDQPIQVDLIPVNDVLQIRVSTRNGEIDRRVQVDKSIFCHVMSSAALDFFSNLAKLVRGKNLRMCNDMIARVIEIQRILGT